MCIRDRPLSDDTDLTIAVNLGGPIDRDDKIIKTDNFASTKKSPFGEKISDFVTSFKGDSAVKVRREWDAYDVANQAFDAMQSTIARQKLAAYPPDYFIEIARNTCGTLEFDLTAEMIDLGYKKAKESLSHVPSKTLDESSA